MTSKQRQPSSCENCKEVYDLIDHIPYQCPETDCKMGTKCFNCWTVKTLNYEMKSGNTIEELTEQIIKEIHDHPAIGSAKETWNIDGEVTTVKEEIKIIDKKLSKEILIISNGKFKLLDSRGKQSADINKKKKYFIKNFEHNGELEIEARQKYVGA